MAYSVELRPAAEKALSTLPEKIQNRILDKLIELEDDPRPRGVVKLRGADGAYRVRVGDYRIVYEIDDKVLVIFVIEIGHRRDVYR